MSLPSIQKKLRAKMDRHKNPNGRALRNKIKTIEDELRIAAKILDWEISDRWRHVGARLPGDRGIAVRMFRRPEQGNKDWLVHFDFSLKKLFGVRAVPREAGGYTQNFKAPTHG